MTIAWSWRWAMSRNLDSTAPKGSTDPFANTLYRRPDPSGVATLNRFTETAQFRYQLQQLGSDSVTVRTA